MLHLEWLHSFGKSTDTRAPVLSSSFHCLGFGLGIGFCRFHMQPGLSSTTPGIHIACIGEMGLVVPPKQGVLRLKCKTAWAGKGRELFVKG